MLSNSLGPDDKVRRVDCTSREECWCHHCSKQDRARVRSPTAVAAYATAKGLMKSEKGSLIEGGAHVHRKSMLCNITRTDWRGISLEWAKKEPISFNNVDCVAG